MVDTIVLFRLGDGDNIGELVEHEEALQIALDDGFENYADFREFFAKTYKLKSGDRKLMQLIKWEV
jgi:hypothetical protein